ncbi:MAG: phosphatase, partial [Gammaproteobacteria bacterium]
MLLNKLAIAIGIALATTQVLADETNFDKFTPMTTDPVAGSLPESAPFQLSSPDFRQVNIVTRDINNLYRFDSGNYDMHTVNENGPDAGRYLFSPFETGQAGIQRTDLTTMQTVTIWASPAAGEYRSFDASR